MERFGSQLKVPDDGWLFAGSALLLETGTSYELRLTLNDPDGKGTGAKVSRVLKAQTRSEPRVSASAGNVTSCQDPAGARERPLTLSVDWPLPARPRLPAICSCCIPASTKGPGSSTGAARRQNRSCGAGWQTTAAALVVIDGQGASPSRPAHAIEVSGTHDVWIEDLTIQNAMHGVTFHDSARIVVRRCHIQKVEYGMNAASNTQGTLKITSSRTT